MRRTPPTHPASARPRSGAPLPHAPAAPRPPTRGWRRAWLALLGALATLKAHAGAALMIGVSHNFGGGTGVTIKLLSSNRPDRPVAAVGLTFQRGSPQGDGPGVDVGLGVNGRRGSVVLGRDLTRGQWQIAAGLSTRGCPPAPPPAAPAPPPFVSSVF